MTNIKMRKLRAGTALQALALLGATAGVTAFAAAPAAAQDYTSGAIAGTVLNEEGAPVAGAEVTVVSNSLGFRRTATTGSGGSFRFAALPAGTYDVTVESADIAGYRAEGVRVASSETSTLDIAVASAGSTEIVVTGSAITRAFPSSTGRNVDLAELVKTTPISRDLTSVVLLAPGTNLGDDGFGNLASIGGASVAENAYYINGLNTTNFDNYLGSAQIPFEFYRSVEMKTSGYSAEFGRATGGIVNAVSKSGTNNFMAAMHLNWSPNFLRSRGENLQNCSTTPCRNTTNRAMDETSSYSAILESGGALIQDRLFVYGLVEFRRSESLRINRNTNIGTKRVSTDPFYAFKVDAYPIDGHHFEFTGFDTRQKELQSSLAYSEVDGRGQLGNVTGLQENYSGGFNFVGKYTGTLSSWLTVSAAYGRVRDTFQEIGLDEGSNNFFYQNASGATVNGVVNGGIYNGQVNSSRSDPYNTEREFYRADVDLNFEALGTHHVRAGFDLENNTLNHVSVRTGGATLVAAGILTPEAFNANFGGAGAALILRANNVVEVNYFNGGGGFEAQNKAFYIQDEWKVTDRLTLNLGVRRDDFRLDKPGGSEYITLKENYAPRLAASYDLWEDQRGRLFGSYGHYYLPVASNTAFRQASPEIYIRERFNYDGFLPNGLPNVTGQHITNPSYQAACPIQLTTYASTGLHCNVTGDGTVKPTDASLSSTLQATRQSEWVVGYKHRFNDLTLGLSYIRRSMDVSAEDVAVDAAILAYCDANGLVGCDDTWTGFHQYVLLNPGKDATFALAGQDGRTITLSADDLRYPKPVRTYDAVEFTFERPWDGKWSIGGSYTWSKSKGNSEGFVQSDFEQSDSGVTQDFDQPGFTQYAYGYLPNHRTHRFKLNGAYAFDDKLSLGANVRVESPRRLSCFGFNPNPNYFDPNGDPYSDFGNAYGAASHYCGGQPAPRGEGLKTDWVSNFDISVRYNLKLGGHNVLLRGDVFNLFNSQSIMGRNEIGELDIEVANPNYGVVSGYQTPRTVRLGLDIAF